MLLLGLHLVHHRVLSAFPPCITPILLLLSLSPVNGLLQVVAISHLTYDKISYFNSWLRGLLFCTLTDCICFLLGSFSKMPHGFY